MDGGISKGAFLPRTVFINNNSSCFLKSVDEVRAPNLNSGATNMSSMSTFDFMCAQTMFETSGAKITDLSGINLLAI